LDKLVTAKVRGKKGALYQWAFKKRGIPGSWDGEDVRYKFYISRSGFASKRKTILDEGLADIKRTALVLQADINDQDAREEWIEYQEAKLVPYIEGKQSQFNYDPHEHAKYLDPKNYDVDHTLPLAKHWQSIGWDSTFDERKNIAGGDGNLQLMWHSYNRSKGAEGGSYKAKWEVGGQFTSHWTINQGWEWADDKTKFD